jgi:hypothetical protein
MKVINYIFNILFYLKNLMLKNYNTPKELRKFSCFMCGEYHVFPITSKDFFACDKCYKTLGEKYGKSI